MNWTYTDCNSSRENPRYICIFFVCFLYVVLVKLEKKKIFFFSFFSQFFIFYVLLNFPSTSLLLNFHFHIFLWFFSIREKNLFFFFLSFFLFSLFCFLVVFLFFFLFSSFFSFFFLFFCLFFSPISF